MSGQRAKCSHSCYLSKAVRIAPADRICKRDMAVLSWKPQSQRAKYRVGMKLVRAAAARLSITGKSVFQPGHRFLSQPSGQPGLHGLLLVLDAQRQAARKIILPVIRLRKKVAGKQLRRLAEDVTAIGLGNINDAAVGGNRRRTIGRRRQAGELAAKS